jgi:S1-C subfamily serine protease
MGRYTMCKTYSNFSRGAVAALLGITFAGVSSAGAQVVRKDTVILRTFPFEARVDSIKVLMRALEQEQLGSQHFTTITHLLDSLVVGAMGGQAASRRESFMFRGPLVPEGALPKGYIGINAQGPRQFFFDSTGQRVIYLAYPSIVSVEPESPAGRAGILPGDLLLAYDGIDVIGHEFNLARLLVPDRKLGVSVKHEGERKDYSLVIARSPERMAIRMLDPDGPQQTRIEVRRASPGNGAMGASHVEAGRMRTPLLPGGIFLMSANGVLGVKMSAVGADLARTLHLSTGVLVNDVPENSPAFSSGLRAGDVVVSIGGKTITNLEELHAAFGAFMGTREAPFRVVRDKKSRDITVRW